MGPINSFRRSRFGPQCPSSDRNIKSGRPKGIMTRTHLPGFPRNDIASVRVVYTCSLMPLLFIPNGQASQSLCYSGFLMLICVCLLALFLCLTVSIELPVSFVFGDEETESSASAGE